jgi:CxxC-x17-CxxC domain-containing protein
MSAFVDKNLKCLDCGNDFVYAAAEQELHKSLGYQNEPKRCGPCREAKRQRKGPREGGGGGGGGAPRPPREGGGGGGAGGPRPPRDGGRAPRPPGGGGQGPRPGGGGRPPEAPRREPREEGGGPGRDTFIAICAGCGKEAVLPFKPRGDRPIFCIDCFEQKKSSAV